MYRIPIVCVTACILILGCGGPSASDLHELEKRVSATEKNRSESETTSALDSEANSLAKRLDATEQNIDQRLSGIEKTVAALAKKQQATQPTIKETAVAGDASSISELEERIADLESKVAASKIAEKPIRSLVPTRDVADAETSEMASDSKADTITAKKGQKNRGTKPFEMTLLSWNVESEGSDPKVIAKQLSEMNRYDVFGLSEVLPEAIETFAGAVGNDYRTIASRSGRNDRLQIIYNSKKFDLLERLELSEINFENRYRSPLVARLQDKKTGQQILVVNNHLARGREEVRTKQAGQLVEWARNQNTPIVAIGDYNFDYVFKTRKGNDGFVAMMRDNIWRWVEPVELIDTNWYDNPRNPDGIDDYPGGMLDFAFVAGAATTWKTECRIIVRPGDFPDDEKTSDHRPF